MNNKTAVRVLVGIASGAGQAPYQRFLESLPPFYSQLSTEYDVEIKWIVGKRLDDAQCEIAEYAIEHNFEYILMMEDDHWGHNLGMVHKLFNGLDETHPIVASRYFSRHYPFLKTAMNHIEGEKREVTEGVWTDFYTEAKGDSGYQTVDLASFGMMLITTEVFKKLERPYFRFSADVDTTDNDFCRRLKSIGIRPKVCFDYILPHRDLTEETVQEEIKNLAQDRFNFKVWRIQQNKFMQILKGIPRLRKFIQIAKRGNSDIKEQLQFLEDFVISQKASVIVELGTRKGVSTSAFLVGILRRIKDGYAPPHLWTVDVLDLELPWWHEEYSEHITRLHGDDRTIEIPWEIQYEGIDILFIDSSHLADHTKNELEKWGPYVKEGGLILLHDAKVCEKGVNEPAKEFVKKHNLQYLLDDRQCGMGVMFINKSLRNLEESYVN